MEKKFTTQFMCEDISYPGSELMKARESSWSSTESDIEK